MVKTNIDKYLLINDKNISLFSKKLSTSKCDVLSKCLNRIDGTVARNAQ